MTVWGVFGGTKRVARSLWLTRRGSLSVPVVCGRVAGRAAKVGYRGFDLAVGSCRGNLSQFYREGTVKRRKEVRTSARVSSRFTP